MRPSRIQIIAVDANQLSGAVFRRTKLHGLVLLRFSTTPRHESPEISIAALTTALPLSGVVDVVLPGYLTLMKSVKTPAIAKAKYGKIAEFEASQCIPGGMGEVVWDYAVVADDQANLEMMIVAAKADTVTTWRSATAAAGLSVERIAPGSVALYRSFRFNYPEMTAPALFVYVNTKSTEIMLVDTGRHFFRTVALGDGSLVAVLGGDLRSSPEQLSVFSAKLANEIAKSVAQVRIQTGLSPTEIFVSAEPSLLAELTRVFAVTLNLPVTPYDAFRRVAVANEFGRENASALAHALTPMVGIAAALKTDARDLAINLLPKSIRVARAIHSRQPWWLAAAALFVVSILPALWYFRAEAEEARSAVAATEARLSFVREVTRRNQENLKKVEVAQKRLDALQTWAERRTSWTVFLADLQSRLGSIDDAWLERLAVVEAPVDHQSKPELGPASAIPIRVGVTGRLLDRKNPQATVSNEAGNRVRQLIVKLAQSRFIDRVEDEHFDHSTPGVLQFQLTLVASVDAPL